MNKIIHMKSKRHWPWVPHVEAGAAPPNRSTGAACGAILLANGLLAAAAGAAAPESRENKSPPPEAAGWDGDVTGEPEPSRSMLACGENGFVAGPLLFSFSIFSACKKQSCWISLPKQVESKRRGGSKLLKTERDTVINFVQENYVKDTDVLVSLKKNRSTCRGFFFFFFLCVFPLKVCWTHSAIHYTLQGSVLHNPTIQSARPGSSNFQKDASQNQWLQLGKVLTRDYLSLFLDNKRQIPCTAAATAEYRVPAAHPQAQAETTYYLHSFNLPTLLLQDPSLLILRDVGCRRAARWRQVADCCCHTRWSTVTKNNFSVI